ncbi:helix-turn-helix domain-containing protein [Priestia megaterium]|uniref:helix-turn-helix domain-containing protein n=1 Tax=Priestia megaterium TaxID=1404 RepID=UPI002E20AD7B|nr:hypothetical protein [Priestia megaterium]
MSNLKANKEVLSKLTYINMRNRGMNKAAIAKHFGISASALSYHINKWEKEGLEKEVIPSVATKNNQNKKTVPQGNKKQEYEDLMNELSGKLKTREADVKQLEEKLKHFENIADFSRQEKEKAERKALNAENEYKMLCTSSEQLSKVIKLKEAQIKELYQKNEELNKQNDEHVASLEKHYVNLELEHNQLLAQIEKLQVENEKLKSVSEVGPAPVGIDTEHLSQEVARLSHENNLFKQTLKIVL